MREIGDRNVPSPELRLRLLRLQPYFKADWGQADWGIEATILKQRSLHI